MADVLLLATLFVVCGGIGLPMSYLIPARYAWRGLTAPAFGFGVLAVLSPVTYRWGVSVPVFFFAAVAAAVMLLALYSGRLLGELRTVERRHLWIVGGGWLILTVILVLPRFVGGEQLIAYQGNPWDTYAYLESSMTYARRSHASLLVANEAQIAQYPFLELAKIQLDNRPSTHLLFATFTRVTPDAMYRLYYTFLVGCYAQFILVAVFAVRQLLPRASPMTWIAIAGVFPLGFWGQYIFDINAWSHVASASILLLLFTLLVFAAAGDRSVRLAGATAIAIAGALYLYPEGLLIYAAALFPTVGLFALVRTIRARRIELRAFVPFTALAGIATGLLYAPTLPFLWKQITWSSGARVVWWDYFQGFFQGRDAQWGAGFDQKADFTAGLFGMYFATPAGDGALAALQRGAIVFLAFALLAAAVALAIRGSAAVRAWAVATLVLMLPAAYLYHAQNYWPAGKVFSYGAPILLLLLCMAIENARWLVIPFIAFQLATGVTRIVAASNRNGIPYGKPYPAVHYAPAKRDFAYAVRGLEPHLTRSMKVVLHPTYVWLEQRLVVFLFSRRIPYVKLGDSNTYFGDGRTVAAAPIPWTPDVELSVDKRTLVLHFPSGNRPDIRVVAE